MDSINISEILKSSDTLEAESLKLELLHYQLHLVMDIIEDWHWARGHLDRERICEEMRKRIAKERRKQCLKVLNRAKDLGVSAEVDPALSSPLDKSGNHSSE